jgi:hypothetical protein
MAEHLGDKIGRLRRMADLTQEGLSEKSNANLCRHCWIGRYQLYLRQRRSTSLF